MTLIQFAESCGKDVFDLAEAVKDADKRREYERLKQFGIFVTPVPGKLPVINYNGMYYVEFPSIRIFINQLRKNQCDQNKQ